MLEDYNPLTLTFSLPKVKMGEKGLSPSCFIKSDGGGGRDVQAFNVDASSTLKYF
jgi:hypothetical protein